jgi:hypothetical protein
MKKILIFSCILGFFLLNIFSLYDFSLNAVGNYAFYQNDFQKARNYYTQSHTKESVLNTANALYKEKKYNESLAKYLTLASREEGK